jgi:hypothetical protein
VAEGTQTVAAAVARTGNPEEGPHRPPSASDARCRTGAARPVPAEERGPGERVESERFERWERIERGRSIQNERRRIGRRRLERREAGEEGGARLEDGRKAELQGARRRRWTHQAGDAITQYGTLRIERKESLAVLRLDKGRGNAIDGPLVEDIARACAELAADGSVRGVLLASAHPKLFCPGLDLIGLLEHDRAAMERFMARFAESVWALYGLEKPVVAALSGHAIAGGCVLA